MAETLFIPENSDKQERYKSLLPQIKALTDGEPDLTANLANVASALYFGMSFFWVGFYRVDNSDELVLGPFHGPPACTRIRYGKGVCGTAWKKSQTIIVPDVDKFPGHIACSNESKSEIVICLKKSDKTAWILDIDSDHINGFDQTDKQFLEQLCNEIIEPLL